MHSLVIIWVSLSHSTNTDLSLCNANLNEPTSVLRMGHTHTESDKSDLVKQTLIRPHSDSFTALFLQAYNYFAAPLQRTRSNTYLCLFQFGYCLVDDLGFTLEVRNKKCDFVYMIWASVIKQKKVSQESCYLDVHNVTRMYTNLKQILRLRWPVQRMLMWWGSVGPLTSMEFQLVTA